MPIRRLHTLSGLDVAVFKGLTTPSLQILGATAPFARTCRDGEETLIPTREFGLWPALLSLVATRVDVTSQKAQLHMHLIEAAEEYRQESKDAERSVPGLEHPMDMARLRLRALDRCLLGFVRRAVPRFHDEDPDWILRQALRVARDAERALIGRDLAVESISPGLGLDLVAVLGLVPQRFLVRTPAGDTLFTAFKEACNVPTCHDGGDLAVNLTLLHLMPELAFQLVDLFEHG